MLNNKAIIIVRYENDEKLFVENIKKLSKYIKVYIYDNSRHSISIKNKNIYYYHDSSNSGLAKAINHCINIAIDNGIEQAIYFDQDSIIDLNLINKLFYSYNYLKLRHNNLFALGPQPIMENGNDYPIRVIENIENSYYRAKEIITSGMTFKLKDIKNIGYFDEKLFLDVIDFDICWRANENNQFVAIDKNIKMVHKVGINTIKIPFKVLPISSPIRNYYQTRNVLYCALYKNKKNKLTIAYYMLRRFANVIINLIFADKRIERLKYNIKGIKDAINEKMGKYNK